MKNNSELLQVCRKLFIILVLLFLAIFLFKTAPYYKPIETFEKGALRVVVNSKDVTNSMPHKAFMENDIIMMSSNTIMKYFDIYVYYDENYDTAIITSQDTVAKIKLGENAIDVNGEVQSLKGTAEFEIIEKINESGDVEKEDVLYLPISSITEIASVKLDFNEKIIATTNSGIENASILEVDSKLKLKSYKRELSKTKGVAKKGEKIYIFNESIESGDDYVLARNIRGDIGYVPIKEISTLKSLEKPVISKTIDNNIYSDKKLSLVWEYAENYTPNRNGESKNEAIDIISPTWLYVDENLALKTTTDESYIKWAKSRNYDLWPTLKNDGRTLDEISNLVNDMELRTKFINEVTNYAIAHDFEGINIDFEYMYKKDKNVFSQFVRELAATLRRNNIIVSIDVTIPGGSDTYSLCYDRTALSKAVDYMMLMAYDQYGSWSKFSGGPTASLEWVENNINAMLGYEGVDNKKLFLCVPFYYRSWLVNKETDAVKSTSTPFIKDSAKVLERYKDKVVWNDEDGQYYVEVPEGNSIRKIWIESKESLVKKIELINKYDLAGLAAWRWGYESSKEWQVINETLENR